MSDIRKVVVRAIDVGYGHVKFTKACVKPGLYEYSSFPSVPVIDTLSPSMSFEETNASNTVTVNAHGTRYIVGPDAYLELKSDSNSRVLHDDYVEEEGYLALNYGAMYYMDTDEIDYLVVGLPVSLFHQRKQNLIDLLTGEHRITDNKVVTVKNVVVLPQPLGALFNYVFNVEDPETGKDLYESLKEENSLVVDPGYKTFDWVYTRFVHPLQKRSGSYHGAGMSRILENISDLLQKKEGKRITNMERLEKGMILYLNGKKPEVKLWGRKMDISEHIEASKSLAVEAVSKLKNSVGNGEDVDNIILTGGPAKFFEDALSEAYPNHTIMCLKRNQLANVEGYQQAGIIKAYNTLSKDGIPANKIALL